MGVGIHVQDCDVSCQWVSEQLARGRTRQFRRWESDPRPLISPVQRSTTRLRDQDNDTIVYQCWWTTETVSHLSTFYNQLHGQYVLLSNTKWTTGTVDVNHCHRTAGLATVLLPQSLQTESRTHGAAERRHRTAPRCLDQQVIHSGLDAGKWHCKKKQSYKRVHKTPKTSAEWKPL